MSIGTREGKPVKGTFIQATRAYYRKVALPGDREVEEIMVMCDAAAVEEFGIRWFEFSHGGGGPDPSPQLGMFYGSWAWFDLCPGLFEWLALQNGRQVTAEEVVAKLLELGFEDETPEVDPHTGDGPGKREVGQGLPEHGGK